MKTEEEVNSPLIALVGFISAVLVFAVIVALQALYMYMSQCETQRKDDMPGASALADALAQQHSQLHSYRWVDEKKKIVAIPIDRAMDLVLQELTSSPDRLEGTRHAP